MTNQSQAAPEEIEKPTLDLLLRRFKMRDDFIDKIEEDNIKAGVDPSAMRQFVQRPKNSMRTGIQYWIDAVTNPNKKNKFHTVKYLRQKELIPEDAALEYEGRE